MGAPPDLAFRLYLGSRISRAHVEKHVAPLIVLPLPDFVEPMELVPA